MGPPGYSRKLLLEKWMRDAKINDLFEGTGQIKRLIIARRLLGYSSGRRDRDHRARNSRQTLTLFCAFVCREQIA